MFQYTITLQLKPRGTYAHIASTAWVMLPHFSPSKLRCLIQMSHVSFLHGPTKEMDNIRGELSSPFIDTQPKTQQVILRRLFCLWMGYREIWKSSLHQTFLILAPGNSFGWITLLLSWTWYPTMHHTSCMSRSPGLNPSFCFTSHSVHPWSCSWAAFPTSL